MSLFLSATLWGRLEGDGSPPGACSGGARRRAARALRLVWPAEAQGVVPGPSLPPAGGGEAQPGPALAFPAGAGGGVLGWELGRGRPLPPPRLPQRDRRLRARLPKQQLRPAGASGAPRGAGLSRRAFLVLEEAEEAGRAATRSQRASSQRDRGGGDKAGRFGRLAGLRRAVRRRFEAREQPPAPHGRSLRHRPCAGGAPGGRGELGRPRVTSSPQGCQPGGLAL